MKKRNTENISLENKILKKVYKLETKNTFIYLLSRIFFGIIFLFFTYVFSSVIFDVLHEQQSFDLFFFLKDDLEVVRKYFFGNIIEFFQEIPQPLFLLLIISILLLLVIILVLIKNYKKIRNKLISIYKFYKTK